MNSSNIFNPYQRKDRPALLAFSLLLSVLLHLLVVFILPHDKLTSNIPLSKQDKPTIVRLVDKPQSDKPKEYELDQLPTKPAVEPPPENSRLAEQDQRVEKEMAPKGDDSRDQAAKQAQRQVPEQKQSQTQRATTKPSRAQKESTKTTQPQIRPATEKGKLPALRKENLPPLEQLTQLSPNTLGRITQNEQALRERIKERSDLETGDTVWLNLKRGLLISFFRRFHNQIEGVWNYPREAIEKEQQGTLLLKITIDREGELIDVDLLKGSGSEILDFEAIQAVYRAAPFGPLGKHYPHPDLKIMAHFSYRITGKYIYGKQR